MIIYMLIVPAKILEGNRWIVKAFAGLIFMGILYTSWYYVYKPQLEILKKKEQ